MRGNVTTFPSANNPFLPQRWPFIFLRENAHAHKKDFYLIILIDTQPNYNSKMFILYLNCWKNLFPISPPLRAGSDN